MSPDRFPDLLTPKEVGELFGVTGKTVSQWALEGRLPSIKTPGGVYRFRRSDVTHLLAAERTTVANDGAPMQGDG